MPPERADLIRTATTFLFVPGDRPERFDKAAAAGADLVVVDLEDAVAVERKSEARTAVAGWLAHGGRACVRVNDVAGAWHRDDLAALAGLPGLLAVMVPKAADPVALSSVARTTAAPVIALVESAEGLAGAREIALSPGVARLAFGHLDYALDLGARPTWSAMLQARSELVLASRLAGLPGPVDGVTARLDDLELIAADVRSAVELGMTGKLLIHPRQVTATRRGFAPDEEAVRWAIRVIAAADGAATSGTAATRIDGEMVDAPVIARARAILSKAEAPLQ
jgi:citrate lyase subunit beta / citryl-CoA lyase